jgi:hypothetical protein
MTPTPQHRRIKRGIVAGYIHDISRRHAPASTTRAVPATTAPPVTVEPRFTPAPAAVPTTASGA